MIYFDSDYMAGAHPQVMQALVESNLEQTTGYGSDAYTAQAAALIRQACDAPQARVHFLVGGTQTNATVIDGLLARHQGVLAAESAHINVHESGAIEASGHKVLTLPQHEGKVKADEVKAYIDEFYRDDSYEHMVAPGMLYISFPTEYGTLYSLQELSDLSQVCHEADIPLYVDGARLGYGLAASDVSLPDLARLCDVFYIGGTKMGALFGEAVVINNDKLLKHFFPLIKQHGALLAKGRLLGVQFKALFSKGLYEEIGREAVAKALRLKAAFVEKGYQVEVDSPTNQQFFRLPNSLIDRLKQEASFEYWGPRGQQESVVRFVTSWATSDEDIDQLIALL
ncbi:MAG: aminotransferase class V-fold PLP-dependent enzyme [Bacteroidales bacterium]|nr:aminotransferase class V-fold PLP-dependent enzyme [Bacteroidales bacterium]MBR0333545.1 aminotransferase class V-fold PLP-dependent enzyme [Bacteroidales bacterium]